MATAQHTEIMMNNVSTKNRYFFLHGPVKALHIRNAVGANFEVKVGVEPRTRTNVPFFQLHDDALNMSFQKYPSRLKLLTYLAKNNVTFGLYRYL